MYLTVKLAKFLMKLKPVKPVNNPDNFQQEIFRHPDYLRLNEQEKKEKKVELANKEYLNQTRRPFELFYPNFPFEKHIINKTVLDVGCSIGALTYDFAKKWQPRAMYGIDVDCQSVDTANTFIRQVENKKTRFEFICAYGEKLPFDDETFDAIISHDTIEHVRDVEQTLKEMKRVTKKNGLLFLVFPSYRFPFGGAHLGLATRIPFLEWFFSADTLNKALLELQANWSDEYNWCKHKSDLRYGKWEKIEGGIGINGITYKSFNKLINRLQFSKVDFFPTPLLQVSFIIQRKPYLRCIPKLLYPLLRISPCIEYLSHRLVYILTK
jgi:ubiquinone/menaquinone biosynthesis C-methylase UbiE